MHPTKVTLVPSFSATVVRFQILWPLDPNRNTRALRTSLCGLVLYTCTSIFCPPNVRAYVCASARLPALWCNFKEQAMSFKDAGVLAAV